MIHLKPAVLIVVGAVAGILLGLALGVPYGQKVQLQAGERPGEPEEGAGGGAGKGGRIGKADPAKLLAATEKELQAERAKAKDLEDRLHKTEADLAVFLAKGGGTAAGGGTVGTGGAAGDGTAAASPEVQKRVEEIQKEIEEAVAAKDGKKLMALMKELGKLGPAGFETAYKLTGILFADSEGGANGFGLGQKDLYMLMSSKELFGFQEWVLGNPELVTEARVGSVWSIAWSDNPNSAQILSDILKTEGNTSVLETAVQALGMTGKASVSALVAGLDAQTGNPGARAALVGALAGQGSDEAFRAIERLQLTERDDSVRAAIDTALIIRNPPVQGFLVQSAVPDQPGQLVGLKPGDIIVRYNGSAVTDQTSLSSEEKKVGATESTYVEVYRGGQVVRLKVNGGRLGISGRGVAPKK